MRHCTLAALLAMALPAAAAPDDPVKKELEKLQGTWVVQSIVFNGKEIDIPKDQIPEFVIEGSSYHMTKDGGLHGTFKIDPTKKPKTVDRTDGGEKDQVYLGIYELDVDTLKFCSSLSDKVRPSTFS